MKRVFFYFVLIALSSAAPAGAAKAKTAPKAGAAPKLVVILVVDQMRADYLFRPGADFTGGLKTLKEQAACFTNAHITIIPTQTAPGHALIATGRSPQRTGIVGDDWWDHATNSRVSAIQDFVHGTGPSHLMDDALGDVLKAKDPACRVVSLSMTDGAAVMMGGRKADMVFWFDPEKAEFVTSSYYGPPPAWLADFNAAHRISGSFSKINPGSREFLSSPQADEWLIELAEQCVKNFPLGADNHPDILSISLSASHFIGQQYGPNSAEVRDYLTALDGALGKFFSWMRMTVGTDVDVILTADHGVMPIPEEKTGDEIAGRRVPQHEIINLMERELQGLYPSRKGHWIVSSSWPNIYLNRELAANLGLDWQTFLEDASQVITNLDDVAAVYAPGHIDKEDPFADVYERSIYPTRSGDLLLRMDYGVLVTESDTGTGHGSPYDYDTHVPLLFWGPDFRTDQFADVVDVRGVAPTLGIVLGLPYPAEDGARSLREALK